MAEPIVTTRDTIPLSLGMLGPDGQPVQVTYHFTPMTMLRRNLFHRSVTAAGASYPAPSEVTAAVRSDIEMWIHAGDQAKATALVDAAEAADIDLIGARIAGAGGARAALDKELGEDKAADLRQTLEEFERRGGAYASVIAQRIYYIDVAAAYALCHALVSVEGLELPHRPDARGVWPEAMLEDLPEGHAQLAGYKAMEMVRPSGAAAKKSQSSPNTTATRASSRAGRTRKTGKAGGSARTGTT